MQKGTTTILLTVLSWGVIVGLYCYEYVSTGVRHPSALARVPVDLESVALERIWWMQLLGFSLTRLPFLLGALFLILVIERRLFRPGD